MKKARIFWAERARNAYISEQFPNLLKKLESLIDLTQNLSNQPDAQLTSRLRKNSREFTSLTDELDMIEDAHATIISNMRSIRDRIVILIIGCGGLVIVALVGSFQTEGLREILCGTAGLIAYALLFLAYPYTSTFFERNRKIEQLLKKHALTRIGT
ncbi:MAG: hypothetical protein HYU39_03585 [Thaumarchaeota archaeon]|nr:hypothetical protein [Nitrososphaerota archaeon]